ncbi:unnamed protein product [Somion occarium]|uniref:Uncharacterized protein n=1 Tax=Somion occarium TaxID=3059160 RepID=A0ABP1D4H2_9APHY
MKEGVIKENFDAHYPSILSMVGQALIFEIENRSPRHKKQDLQWSESMGNAICILLSICSIPRSAIVKQALLLCVKVDIRGFTRVLSNYISAMPQYHDLHVIASLQHTLGEMDEESYNNFMQVVRPSDYAVVPYVSPGEAPAGVYAFPNLIYPQVPRSTKEGRKSTEGNTNGRLGAMFSSTLNFKETVTLGALICGISFGLPDDAGNPCDVTRPIEVDPIHLSEDLWTLLTSTVASTLASYITVVYPANRQRSDAYVALAFSILLAKSPYPLPKEANKWILHCITRRQEIFEFHFQRWNRRLVQHLASTPDILSPMEGVLEMMDHSEKLQCITNVLHPTYDYLELRDQDGSWAGYEPSMLPGQSVAMCIAESVAATQGTTTMDVLQYIDHSGDDICEFAHIILAYHLTTRGARPSRWQDIYRILTHSSTRDNVSRLPMGMLLDIGIKVASALVQFGGPDQGVQSTRSGSVLLLSILGTLDNPIPLVIRQALANCHQAEVETYMNMVCHRIALHELTWMLTTISTILQMLHTGMNPIPCLLHLLTPAICGTVNVRCNHDDSLFSLLAHDDVSLEVKKAIVDVLVNAVGGTVTDGDHNGWIQEAVLLIEGYGSDSQVSEVAGLQLDNAPEHSVMQESSEGSSEGSSEHEQDMIDINVEPPSQDGSNFELEYTASTVTFSVIDDESSNLRHTPLVNWGLGTF